MDGAGADAALIRSLAGIEQALSQTATLQEVQGALADMESLLEQGDFIQMNEGALAGWLGRLDTPTAWGEMPTQTRVALVMSLLMTKEQQLLAADMLSDSHPTPDGWLAGIGRFACEHQTAIKRTLIVASVFVGGSIAYRNRDKIRKGVSCLSSGLSGFGGRFFAGARSLGSKCLKSGVQCMRGYVAPVVSHVIAGVNSAFAASAKPAAATPVAVGSALKMAPGQKTLVRKKR